MRAVLYALRWAPALAWMGLISYWSGQSDLPIDHPRVAGLLQGQQHPLAHAGAFGVLALLVWWALRPARRAAPVAWLVVAAFGALDEWHQGLTPGRAVELQDWLVDAGVAFGVICLASLVDRGQRAVLLRIEVPGIARVLQALRTAPRQLGAPRVPAPGLFVAGRLVYVSAIVGLAVSVLLIATPGPDSRHLVRQAATMVGRLVPERVQDRAEGFAQAARHTIRALRTELREQVAG